MSEFGIPEYDAAILTTSKYISDYYENCVKLYNNPKKLSNWIMVDLLKLVKDQEEFVFPVSEEHLTTIVKMVEDKVINKTIALELLDKVIETKKDPMALAKEMNLLVVISDEEILNLLKKLKAENEKVQADYKVDPEKISKFIIGYVMKNTAGKANSGKVIALIPQVFEK